MKILIAINLLSAPLYLYAEVFKWVDENGNVQFGDSPPNKEKSAVLELGKSNLIKNQSAEKLDFYKKDRFYMPVKKSNMPYRFTLSSRLKGKEPADKLSKIEVTSRQKSFLIHVNLMGVERYKEYNFRSRILDAKGELVFDNVASHTATSASSFFVNRYTPKLATDKPGLWTFQGILNGKKLYLEKKKINFKQPNPIIKPLPHSARVHGMNILSDRGAKMAGGKESSSVKSRKLACPVVRKGSCEYRQLKNEDYSGLLIQRISFDYADLEGVNFHKAKINYRTTFKSAILKGADFSKAKIENVDFTGADLTGADFTDVICYRCNFDDTVFKGAKFSFKRIGSSSFKRAIMTGVELNDQKTISGDFTAADLSGVDFTGVDIRSLNMTDAVLKDAELGGTKLNIKGLLKANMQGCRSCQEQVSLATIDVDLFKSELAQIKNGVNVFTLSGESSKSNNISYKVEKNIQKKINSIKRGESIISDENLVDILHVMFTSKNPFLYNEGFEIIANNYRSEIAIDKNYASLCADNKLLKPILEKVTFQEDLLSKNEKYNYVSAVKIKSKAVTCILNAVHDDDSVYRMLINAYQSEEDRNTKKLLINSLREKYSDVTTPLLIDAIKNGDSEMSAAAAMAFSKWNHPPQKLLPLIVDKFRANEAQNSGWSFLLRSYGAAAAEYLPELEFIESKLKDSRSSYRALSNAIETIKVRSNVSYLGEGDSIKETVLKYIALPNEVVERYELTYTEKISGYDSIFSQVTPAIEMTRFDKLRNTFFNYVDEFLNPVDESALLLEKVNPFYSDDPRLINRLVEIYKIKLKGEQNISSIARVEYKTNHLHEYGRPSHFGVDVFISDSTETAKEISSLLVEMKIPRRLVALKGGVVFVIWGDAISDPELEKKFYQQIKN